MKWSDGRVNLVDSVASSRAISGRELREGFFEDMHRLTLGLVHTRGTSLFLGPVELVRFGAARSTRSSVVLPIEGGLLVGRPGGWLRIAASKGCLEASLEGYRPLLPLPLYVVTQLPFHHTITRLHLLHQRGRTPEPGIPAPPTSRLAAAAIDAGLCAALALTAARRRRVPVLLGIVAAYHVACWTSSGRTVGGLIARQQVVSIDGSRVSAGQAVVRLLTAPLAALRARAVHDEIAGTEVIAD
ncbi:MAG TPA: RDD family protein [Candidatus Dormibacteraeota bacterium]|nr:RDD family protein [Candidatus Dormibacteraeota bacterium]